MRREGRAVLMTSSASARKHADTSAPPTFSSPLARGSARPGDQLLLPSGRLVEVLSVRTGRGVRQPEFWCRYLHPRLRITLRQGRHAQHDIWLTESFIYRFAEVLS